MASSSKLQTKMLDQQRAEHAWRAVQEAKNNNEENDDFEEFCRQAKKLPARIVASGLGQALAFLEAKSYAPALRKALADWVLNKRLKRNASTETDDYALLRAVIEGDARFLRWATDEVLAYLVWLNRFAEAEGKEDEAGSDSGDILCG